MSRDILLAVFAALITGILILFGILISITFFSKKRGRARARRRGRLAPDGSSARAATSVGTERGADIASGVSRLKGVGGWLLFFCIGLTILMPLLTLYNIVSGYQTAKPLFSRFPGLYDLMAIDTSVSFAIVVFSIYAGISLWRIRPGAVGLAKKYLLTLLAYSVLAFFLPFTADLPKTANEVMLGEILKDVVRSLIYVGVWYSYLSKSERVRATYAVS